RRRRRARASRAARVDPNLDASAPADLSDTPRTSHAASVAEGGPPMEEPAPAGPVTPRAQCVCARAKARRLPPPERPRSTRLEASSFPLLPRLRSTASSGRRRIRLGGLLELPVDGPIRRRATQVAAALQVAQQAYPLNPKEEA